MLLYSTLGIIIHIDELAMVKNKVLLSHSRIENL